MNRQDSPLALRAFLVVYTGRNRTAATLLTNA
jgi:hypothetical protein